VKSVLVWDFTQCRLAVSYRRFGTTYRSNLQGSSILTLENGTDKLSRNVGEKLPFYAMYNPKRGQILRGHHLQAMGA